MEIAETRRTNLLELIRLAGSIAALAASTGMSASYLSQLKNGTRDMGSNIARRMEESLRLPRGVLDAPQTWGDVTLDPEPQKKVTVTGVFHAPRLGEIEERVSPARLPNTVRVESFVPDEWDDATGIVGHNELGLPPILSAVEMSKYYLQNITKARDPRSLRIVEASGDSMAPTIVSGDLLLVDMSVKAFQADGIYLFQVQKPRGIGYAVHLKRLQGVRDEIVVKSDNPAYDTWSVPASQTGFSILGRATAAIPLHQAKTLA